MHDSGHNGFADYKKELQELGDCLRQLREAQGLSYEDIAEETHVRPFVLKAIEAGNIEELSGLVYARGFIKTYCEYLCAKDLWLKYEGFLKSRVVLTEPMATLHTDQPYISPRPIFKRTSLVWVYAILLLAVATAGYLLWQQRLDWSIHPMQPPVKSPMPPQVSEDAISKEISRLAMSSSLRPDDEIVTPVIGSASVKIPDSADVSWMDGKERRLVVSGDTPISRAVSARTLKIEVKDKCWVNVNQGNKQLFSGFMKSGESKVFEIKEQARVRLGNAGVVRIEWGKDKIIDPAGKKGTPMTYYFTLSGDIQQKGRSGTIRKVDGAL